MVQAPLSRFAGGILQLKPGCAFPKIILVKASRQHQTDPVLLSELLWVFDLSGCLQVCLHMCNDPVRRRSSFLNSAVSSWMLPDFAHVHKSSERLSKLISCNVITLCPFPSKIFSRTADTSQTCINTKSQPFLVKYGCQIFLVQLAECQSRKFGFVLVFGSFG